MSDEELVALLAPRVALIRDDANKVALLQTLFGRRWLEAFERLREVAAGAKDISVAAERVLNLSLLIKG